mgnify:CR=1 FL=1
MCGRALSTLVLSTLWVRQPSALLHRSNYLIGVAYLARCLASHLQKNQPELGITNRDVGCVEIAGLCHDLGHGPWSHVWDSIFMPAVESVCFFLVQHSQGSNCILSPNSNWKHEQGSEMMFDYMVETYNIPILEKDILFIKALIAGDPAKCE